MVLIIYKIIWHNLIFRRRVCFYSYTKIHKLMTVLQFLNDPWDFWTMKSKLRTTVNYWTALQNIVILLLKRTEASAMLNWDNSCILIMEKLKWFDISKLQLLCGLSTYLNKHALEDSSTNLSHVFVSIYTKRYNFRKKTLIFYSPHGTERRIPTICLW